MQYIFKGWRSICKIRDTLQVSSTTWLDIFFYLYLFQTYPISSKASPCVICLDVVDVDEIGFADVERQVDSHQTNTFHLKKLQTNYHKSLQLKSHCISVSYQHSDIHSVFRHYQTFSQMIATRKKAQFVRQGRFLMVSGVIIVKL